MSMAVVTERGTVTVTDAALAEIVAQAAESVAGAHVRKRGIDVAVEHGGTHVVLELAVDFGRVLPEVARDVQERVSAALGTMCGVHVNAVDVAVEELV
jgi:uncharacterized alkaline shock family protein YloU